MSLQIVEEPWHGDVEARQFNTNVEPATDVVEQSRHRLHVPAAQFRSQHPCKLERPAHLKYGREVTSRDSRGKLIVVVTAADPLRDRAARNASALAIR